VFILLTFFLHFLFPWFDTVYLFSLSNLGKKKLTCLLLCNVLYVKFRGGHGSVNLKNRTELKFWNGSEKSNRTVTGLELTELNQSLVQLTIFLPINRTEPKQNQYFEPKCFFFYPFANLIVFFLSFFISKMQNVFLFTFFLRI